MQSREDFTFLVSEQAQRLLGTDLPVQLSSRLKMLRRTLNAQQAALISQQIELRRKAKAKFTRAQHMLFLAENLEQASAEIISTYRAKRYHGFEQVADLTCGLGGDALALAQGHDLVAVDRDLLKLLVARFNLQVYQRQAHFVVSDVHSWVPRVQAYWLDPSRRQAGHRSQRLQDLCPSLTLIPKLLCCSHHLGIKLSPLLDYQALNYDCEVEVIAVHGECREVVLWFGGLRTNARRRATLLPGGATLISSEVQPILAPLQEYIFEPAAAAIRAGLIGTLAARWQLNLIDPQLCYLTGPHPIADVWLQCYRILAVWPFGLKKLRRALRHRQAGRLQVKARGFVDTGNVWQRRLAVPGDNSYTLFLCRVHRKPLAILTVPAQIPSSAKFE